MNLCFYKFFVSLDLSLDIKKILRSREIPISVEKSEWRAFHKANREIYSIIFSIETK